MSVQALDRPVQKQCVARDAVKRQKTLGILHFGVPRRPGADLDGLRIRRFQLSLLPILDTKLTDGQRKEIVENSELPDHARPILERAIALYVLSNQALHESGSLVQTGAISCPSPSSQSLSSRRLDSGARLGAQQAARSSAAADVRRRCRSGAAIRGLETPPPPSKAGYDKRATIRASPR